jgi:hypothetical protein
MRHIRFSILAAACLAPFSFAFAQSPDLERRVDSLEHKLDAIMELLQQQKGGATPPPEAKQSADASAPEGFVPGLYLDAYASGREYFSAQLAKQADMPTGTPSASAAITPESSFKYDDLEGYSETKSFAVSGDFPPTVIYSGYLMIKEDGKHALGVNITPRRDRCSTKLLMNGKELISRYSNEGTEFDAANADLNLHRGLYKFQLYFRCAGHATFKYEGHKVDLVMAGPEDRAPKPISPDLFFIKQ